MGTLVIASSYPTVLLQAVDEPLHTVTLFVRLLVKFALVLLVRFSWDNDADASSSQISTYSLV